MTVKAENDITNAWEGKHFMGCGCKKWGINMSEKKIQLQNVEEVKEFVSAAEKCEFDIDVKYNHIIVDAKSFLSILALVRTTLCVTSRGYDSTFEKTVDKYAVC